MGHKETLKNRTVQRTVAKHEDFLALDTADKFLQKGDVKLGSAEQKHFLQWKLLRVSVLGYWYNTCPFPG